MVWLYVESPMESTKKLLELISNFSNAEEQEINIPNQLHFYIALAINNCKSKLKPILFTIAYKFMK